MPFSKSRTSKGGGSNRLKIDQQQKCKVIGYNKKKPINNYNNQLFL